MNFLDLIAQAEGTDRGRGYNETLAYGALTGGPVNLVGMTLDEIDALQSRMLAHPDNEWNSSAVGRYQITRTTLRALREQLGLSGDTVYSQQLQDRLATTLAQGRTSTSGLRNEWEGLRTVSDAEIQNAFAGVTAGGGKGGSTASTVSRGQPASAGSQSQMNALSMSQVAAHSPSTRGTGGSQLPTDYLTSPRPPQAPGGGSWLPSSAPVPIPAIEAPRPTTQGVPDEIWRLLQQRFSSLPTRQQAQGRVA